MAKYDLSATEVEILPMNPTGTTLQGRGTTSTFATEFLLKPGRTMSTKERRRVKREKSLRHVTTMTKREWHPKKKIARADRLRRQLFSFGWKRMFREWNDKKSGGKEIWFRGWLLIYKPIHTKLYIWTEMRKWVFLLSCALYLLDVQKWKQMDGIFRC